MIKRDMKTELKHLYKPTDKYPISVNLSVFNYLIFDGFGDSNSSIKFMKESTMQLMHNGLFADEGVNIEKLHPKITNSKKIIFGKHHEIYLSDFRKSSHDKLKTILRQPYK